MVVVGHIIIYSRYAENPLTRVWTLATTEEYDICKAGILFLGMFLHRIATDVVSFNCKAKVEISMRIMIGLFFLPKGVDSNLRIIILKCLKVEPIEQPTAEKVMTMIKPI